MPTSTLEVIESIRVIRADGNLKVRGGPELLSDVAGEPIVELGVVTAAASDGVAHPGVDDAQPPDEVRRRRPRLSRHGD